MVPINCTTVLASGTIFGLTEAMAPICCKVVGRIKAVKYKPTARKTTNRRISAPPLVLVFVLVVTIVSPSGF